MASDGGTSLAQYEKPRRDKGIRSYRIAMISDFFHPSVGGVENHIYMLAVGLFRRGHTVIVITHHHPPDRIGIRYLLPGLKVYHLPLPTISSSATLPNFMLFLPYLRNILLRERIDLVHGHGSLSSMAHEGIMHAPMLGVRTVLTDHSLFGFGDAVGILTNKLLRAALRNVDGVICVSHTGRENTVLRADLDPIVTHVIPNAVVPSRFIPSPSSADPDYITIVVISRLVYRKGVDLLVASAPHICRDFPEVRFVIGGDGPKMVELEQMREKHLLQDRIELIGHVKSRDVRSILCKGQIFLNTSLTEAFGIAIIEAAATGLLVVSTRVGGVPEILPEDMICFAEPNEDDVVRALSSAIHRIRAGAYDPFGAHDRVRKMYSWDEVAERTEHVYIGILEDTFIRSTWDRMWRLLDTGKVFGWFMVIIFSVQHLFLYFLDWAFPRSEIDYVPEGTDWSLDRLYQMKKVEENTPE
ncbi:glycosyltransferase family 4 protein [Phaffia rhodozyma]|uniref:phosphatidylinositol N-acetylglucosaminyltransferase n=1 Tax=Phaffia rhodozyma TaxID=264483 RepID=A0A0F7SHT8_PHARH|nr:glycosyltransferase family 4 protein [Phaffia rhodozyma]